MNYLSLQQVSLAYQGKRVVHEVDLQLSEGQIGCLLGPSGCGKTTLLRAIAGFEPLINGSITLQGQVISHAELSIPPEKRGIGMVFQDYALFPHLSVADNIAFGIRQQSAKARKQRVEQLLELVKLPGFGKRYPHELSGGQQQRVALARALAPCPRLLLLDEPFGSQDMELRERLAREVREILKQEAITALLVTHDQYEAFAMADEIGVMQAGDLQQWGTAEQLYQQPANTFVASFIGKGAWLPGVVGSLSRVHTALGTLQAPTGWPVYQNVQVLMRPDRVQMTTDTDCCQGRIVERLFRGTHFLYSVELADKNRLLVMSSVHERYEVGETVGLGLTEQPCHGSVETVYA